MYFKKVRGIPYQNEIKNVTKETVEIPISDFDRLQVQLKTLSKTVQKKDGQIDGLLK